MKTKNIIIIFVMVLITLFSVNGLIISDDTTSFTSDASGSNFNAVVIIPQTEYEYIRIMNVSLKSPLISGASKIFLYNMSITTPNTTNYMGSCNVISPPINGLPHHCILNYTIQNNTPYILSTYTTNFYSYYVTGTRPSTYNNIVWNDSIHTSIGSSWVKDAYHREIDWFEYENSSIEEINITPTNNIPVITNMSYSATGIDLLYDTQVLINGTASDDESDDIYWAYDCDYSSISEGRVAEEYFNNGENITQIMERLNIDSTSCGTDSFLISYIDSLVGYALNLSQSSCVTPFYKNTTDSQGIGSNSITTHNLVGFKDYLTTEYDGLFLGGFDENGFIIYGIGVTFNGTTNQNEFYILDEITNNFTYITTNDNQPDRILVDLSINDDKYRFRIDEDLDGDIDYVSNWYSILNGGSSYLHDTFYFTTNGIKDNRNYLDLSISAPLRNVYIDTLYVDYVNAPSFSLTPNNTYDFSCNYTSIGNYEIRTWVTDDNHFNNYTSYESQIIQVILGTSPTCTGFVEPTCDFNDLFCDDFSYTNAISCNGWTGTGFSIIPDAGVLDIQEIDPFISDITYDVDSPITELQYNNFILQFDVTINSSDTHTFYVSNDLGSKYLLYMDWDNYQLTSYDYVSPTLNNIGTFVQGQLYEFKAVIDFEHQKIAYYIDDVYITQSDFYDSTVDNAETFKLFWLSNEDITIDNFRIIKGDLNPEYINESVEIVEDYEYNPEMFGAINWTSNTFSKQNCFDRGYSNTSVSISLCPIKAMLSDTASSLYLLAIDNILITIVVIIVIILLVPLIIASRK